MRSPCYVRTPCARLFNPLRSPHARLYPPALVRTLLHSFVLPALASCSFVPSPVLRSYPMCSFKPPALPSCSLVLACSHLYCPRGSVRTSCAHSSPPVFPSLLLLPLPLPLRVCLCWLPGPCAPALHLPSSLWYLTCNRTVSILLFLLYLPFYFEFNISAKQINS